MRAIQKGMLIGYLTCGLGVVGVRLMDNPFPSVYFWFGVAFMLTPFHIAERMLIERITE